MRVAIVGRFHNGVGPQVLDVDTGEDLTNRIPAEWRPLFLGAKAGDVLVFTAYVLSNGQRLYNHERREPVYEAMTATVERVA